MTTSTTLPERAVLDAMRQAANIRVDTIGKWFVVFEGERDIVWYLDKAEAETVADELAMELVEQEMVD